VRDFVLSAWAGVSHPFLLTSTSEVISWVLYLLSLPGWPDPLLEVWARWLGVLFSRLASAPVGVSSDQVSAVMMTVVPGVAGDVRHLRTTT